MRRVVAPHWASPQRGPLTAALGLLSPGGCVGASVLLPFHLCSDNKGLLGCLAQGEEAGRVVQPITQDSGRQVG